MDNKNKLKSQARKLSLYVKHPEKLAKTIIKLEDKLKKISQAWKAYNKAVEGDYDLPAVGVAWKSLEKILKELESSST